MTLTRAQVITHEAAHAAIALRVGLRVDTVRASGFDGEVVTNFHDHDVRPAITKARAKLCVLLAGALVEPCEDRSNADMRSAVRCAELIDPDNIAGEISNATDHTLALLMQTETKQLITAIASRLSEHSPLLHVTAEPLEAVPA